LGIVLAYLFNENPLWWAISAMVGAKISKAFIIFLILRVLTGVICAVMLLVNFKNVKNFGNIKILYLPFNKILQHVIL